MTHHRFSSGVFRLLLVFAAVLCIVSPTTADPGERSPDGLWSEIANSVAPQRVVEQPELLPSAYRAFNLDDSLLAKNLGQAPMELTKEATPSAVVIDLPMPDGTYVRFAVEESPILAPRVAAEFPQIKTFRVRGVDDSRINGRIGWTPRGFSAALFGDGGHVSIARFGKGGVPTYISYFEDDLPGSDDLSCDTEVSVAPNQMNTVTDDVGSDSSGSGSVAIEPQRNEDQPQRPENGLQSVATLKRYELAVVVSNDFYDEIGDTDTEVFSWVADEINRVSEYYERDVSIKLQVVSGAELLGVVFGEHSACTLRFDAHDTIQSIVCPGGQCAYEWDLGHLFDLPVDGAQGCAELGVVCNNNYKGRCVSQWDPYGGASHQYRLVAHEMGHLFGAYHTHSGEGCSQIHHAIEPADGSTMMSYAGSSACDHHLDPPGDAKYFHIRSIVSIRNYTTGYGGGASCYDVWGIANDPDYQLNYQPQLDPLSDRVLPPETEFTLTGSASDVDGDNLTYTWEQYDEWPGPGGDNPLTDAPGLDPLFRSKFPESSPTRDFEGLNTPGNILPTQTGESIRMRLVVRDNHYPNAGQVWDEMMLHVEGEPFRLTYPADGVPIHDQTITVTWNPGGDPAPVDSVNILMKTNGGLWTPLVENTPNDGSHEVFLDIQCPSELGVLLRIESTDGFIRHTAEPFNLICDCPDEYSCGAGCLEDPEDCYSVYDTGNRACWDGQEVHYCEDSYTIVVGHCDCDSMAIGGGGGIGHIGLGCGESTYWTCPLVPACPIERDCGGDPDVCEMVPDTCGGTDTGLSECVRENGSFKTCDAGTTVHAWSCSCTDGPDCNATSETLRCL